MLFVLDLERAEDRLVELAASVVARARSVEVGAGAVQAAAQAPPLGVDVAELGFDLGLRQGAVGGEVDQVFLLGVEFLNLAGQLSVQQPRGCFVFGDDGVDVGSDAGDERPG